MSVCMDSKTNIFSFETTISIDLVDNKIKLPESALKVILEQLEESGRGFQLISAPHTTLTLGEDGSETKKTTFSAVQVCGIPYEVKVDPSKVDSHGKVGKSIPGTTLTTAPPETLVPTFPSPAVSILPLGPEQAELLNKKLDRSLEGEAKEENKHQVLSERKSVLSKHLKIEKEVLDTIHETTEKVTLVVNPNGLLLEGRNGFSLGVELREIKVTDSQDIEQRSLHTFLTAMHEHLHIDHPNHVQHISVGRSSTNLLHILGYEKDPAKNRVLRAFHNEDVQQLRDIFKSSTEAKEKLQRCLDKLLEIKSSYVDRKQRAGKKVALTINPFADMLALQELWMDHLLVSVGMGLAPELARQVKDEFEAALPEVYEDYMRTKQPKGAEGAASPLGGPWGAYMNSSKFERACQLMDPLHADAFEERCLNIVQERYADKSESAKEFLLKHGLSSDLFKEPIVKAQFCRQLDAEVKEKETASKPRDHDSLAWPEFRNERNVDNLQAMLQHMIYQQNRHSQRKESETAS